MVALLENNQRKDGSVEIPLVLHKYLNGVKELCPTSSTI
jgi:seryl-tRNA synthetase